MADKCTDHAQCTRELYAIKQEIFGTDGNGGHKKDIEALRMSFEQLKETLLPRWTQAGLLIILISILGSAIITWAKVENIPETYAKKEIVIENKKDIETVQKQLEELKSMQRSDTKLILQAINGK